MLTLDDGEPPETIFSLCPLSLIPILDRCDSPHSWEYRRAEPCGTPRLARRWLRRDHERFGSHRADQRGHGQGAPARRRHKRILGESQ